MSDPSLVEPLVDGYQLYWNIRDGYRILDHKSNPVTGFWRNDRDVSTIIIGLITKLKAIEENS